MARVRLKDLRGLKVVVVHPPDSDGMMMREQLMRIGCRTDLIWPVPRSLPARVDVVFAGLFFDSQEEIKAMLRRAEKPGPTIIGVVDYENPAMLELLLDIRAMAAASKPVNSFGMLTNLVVARATWREQQETQEKIVKLEKKLIGQKMISKAKSILMDMHGMSELDAHKMIRQQAMGKRTSIEEMAQAIINANDLLSAKPEDV
ncbi:MAG: ANTAR domain-containing protein [Rhodobacteraceae bacterium]|nr:ANTAR domain-containing protein [Paracoccaceae bacterium]